jgi:hypothetical protein
MFPHSAESTPRLLNSPRFFVTDSRDEATISARSWWVSFTLITRLPKRYGREWFVLLAKRRHGKMTAEALRALSATA